jgi:glyoxylase-like metal-dependent hydrolase (beta-lactamase superfamily II)
MVAATGAQVLAHVDAKDKIPGMNRGLRASDVIKIGETVELECLDTPGHTMRHICVRAHGDQPALFCRDTLFNAGAGNCPNGGRPDELYRTFATQLAKLLGETLIYPGHDCIAQSGLHPRPRAGQREGQGDAASDGEAGRGAGTGHHTEPGEGDQHFLPTDQPVRDQAPSRSVPGSGDAEALGASFHL